MEIFKALIGFTIFIGVIALTMALLEKLAKKAGSKAIYISTIFVIPIVIGLMVVVSNYESLEWYEVIYIPFFGSALILAAVLLVLVQLSPEIICLPFKYVWKLIVKKKE